jgi:hypothetical protein
MADPDYNARKASTLPVTGTVVSQDLIMVVQDGAPPDLALATIDAVAELAGSYAPAGPTGATGPTGPVGPAGRDLAVKGTVANFAALPSTGVVDGDTYVTANDGKLYVYDSGPPSSWTAIATAIGPQGPVGAIGPAGPAGATGPQGVQGPAGVGIAGANVPVGTVLDFVGTSAPTGFLMCDGTEHPQASFPQLAALLVGSNWAQASTVGFFRVPLLNGRVTVGIDPADAFFGVVGKTTGGSKHSVPIDHNHPAGNLAMQSHQHGVNIWSGWYDSNHLHHMQHTHPGTGFNNGFGTPFRGAPWNGGGWDLMTQPTSVPTGWYHTPPTGSADREYTAAADRDMNHRHPVNGSSDPAGGAVTGTTGNAGVDGTNRNVQPFAVMSKIIRATV